MFLSSILVQIILYAQLNDADAEPIIGKKVRKVVGDEFPFIVSLKGYTRYSLHHKKNYCGGVLVTKKHVLTAAHCIYSPALMDHAIVIAGSPNLRSPYKKYFKIISWMTYGMWASEKGIPFNDVYDDVAVMRLDTEDTGIEPVIRFPADTETPEGTIVTLAGWGMTNKNVYPVVMRKANLRVTSKANCVERARCVKPDFKLDLHRSGIVCMTADPPVHGIGGDSGNPYLDVNKRLIGIHTGRCPKMQDYFNPYLINMAANVNHYKTFIDDAITRL